MINTNIYEHYINIVFAMPLTRHFYSYDEVQSALYYTVTKRIPDESLFWCQELIDSGYGAEVISTLFESWLFYSGPYCLQWLINSWNTLRSEEISQDDILLATYQLNNISNNCRDNSLWYVLIYPLTTTEIPDRVTHKTPSLWKSNNIVETYFIRAVYQGKAAAAWWCAQWISVERQWELLEWFSSNVYITYSDRYNTCLEAIREYEQLLGYKSDEYDIIMRCTAVIMFCLHKEIRYKSFTQLPTKIDEMYIKTLNNNSNTIGRKEHRCYTIPSGCLYGNTFRSTLKWSQNTYNKLNDIESNLIGCPFWDEAIHECGSEINGKIVWKSDDAMEEFYDKYFQDDIPDEWSKCDKSKSHGDGLLGPTDIIKIGKYSRVHFSKKSRLIWNKNKEINQYLDTLDISSDFILHIMQLYQTPLQSGRQLQEEDLKKMMPARIIYHV